MIVNIYAYRDVQVGAFTGKPFYDTNEPDVVKTQIARTVALSTKEQIEEGHVRDLELFYLGKLDDETGVITSKPTFLIRLSDYIRKESQDEQSIQD